MRSLQLCCAAGLLVALGACSDSKDGGTGSPIQSNLPDAGPTDPSNPGPDSGLRLTTSLNPSTIEVGDDSTVTCAFTDQDGAPVDADLTFSVTPSEGVTIDGDRVIGQSAGEYRVSCEVPDLGLKDTPGAPLTVVAGGAESAAKVTATVAPDAIVPGQSAQVSCAVEDEFGNAVAADTTVTATPTLDIADHTVSSTIAGEYTIHCEVVGNPDVEQVPDTLSVGAGQPAHIELVATPDQQVYALQQVVTFSWIVTDNWDNEVTEPLAATLTVPAVGVEPFKPEEHKHRLIEEGHHTFGVTLDDHPEIGDELTLTVDVTGPLISVKSPERGIQLLGSGEAITVVGSVGDEVSELSGLKINGEPVPVDDDGSFTWAMPTVWGANVILVTASDEWGNTTKVSPTFQYSSGFTSYDDQSAEGVKVPDGASVALGQKALDDGVHDHSDPNDLATILEILLSEIDLLEAIGNTELYTTEIPIFEQDIAGGTFNISGVMYIDVALVPPTDIGNTTVALDSRQGGIDGEIVIGDQETWGLELGLDVTLRPEIVFSMPSLNFQTILFGEALAPNSVVVDSIGLKFGIDIHQPPGGTLQLGFQDLDVTLDGMQIEAFDDGLIFTFGVDFGGLLPTQTFQWNLNQLVDLNALFAAVLDVLTEQLAPFLIDLIEPVIEIFGGELLKPLIEGFAFETSFELPNLFGDEPPADPKSIDIYADLTSVVFTEEGGQIGLGLGAWGEKGVDREMLGAIQRAGCLQGLGDLLVYDWDHSIGIGLKTDALNAVLFAAWWTGFLNMPLSVSELVGDSLPLPIENLVIELDPWLPPIINDCSKAGGVEAELTDVLMYLDGGILGAPLQAWVYADIALQVTFTAGPDGLEINIGQFKFFDVEVLEVNPEAEEAFDVHDLLENQLQPLLETFLIGETFGPIEIPALDLGGLLPGLPEGVELELGPMTIDKQDGYLLIETDLQ